VERELRNAAARALKGVERAPENAALELRNVERAPRNGAPAQRREAQGLRNVERPPENGGQVQRCAEPVLLVPRLRVRVSAALPQLL
jgi:hypothetical protein